MKIVDCRRCGKQTAKSIGRFNESIKNGWNFFCSISCRYAYKEKRKEFFCAFCSKSVKKTPAQVRQTKSNIFCSKSCAAYYNNKHKKGGIRRSKLERYLEQELKTNFPSIEFLCNTNKMFGVELDFYFPDLKLAIELNGIVHFEPIYGVEKLKRVQDIDRKKAEKCKQAGIELHIIDVSREPHLTQKLKEQHWATVKELVTSKKKRAGYTNAQVSSL